MVELHERWRELGTRVLLVLSSVVLTLLLTECGMRVSGVAPLPNSVAGGFRPDHPLLRLLQPDTCRDFGNLEGPYFVEVCTNRVGLRDRNHPSGETPRVLGLGDSFTFGWGVEQNDTFLAHLERTLRLGLPSVRPGVFNTGLSYTSQAHQDALLRYLYDQIRPDLVVLAFSEDNDIDENIIWNPNAGVFPEHGEISRAAGDAYRDELRSVVFHDFLFRHSALVRFFRQRTIRASLASEIAALDARLAAHGLAGAPLSRMTADEARRRFLQAFSDKYDDDWRLTEILLDRIQRFVADRGGKLVLMRIPSRVAVDNDAWSSAKQRFCGSDSDTAQKACGALDRDHTTRRLRAYAGARGLHYVDPGSDLAAATERGEVPYLPEDIHLSRLGHLRAGECLARELGPLLGAKPALPASRPANERTPRKVGAYWYPWYRERDWKTFTDYTPAGGAYISTDKHAIFRQLHRAERGEIDFLFIELVPFYNPASEFNNQAIDALVNAIAERRRRGRSKLQFAVLSDILFGEAETVTPQAWLEMTRRQLDQIWTRFVERYPDAYVRIDGKPLVGIFSPPVFVDDPRFAMIRPTWAPHVHWKDWDRRGELVPFWDTYPQAVTDRRFMSVTPGYNDWRLDRQPQIGPYLPRLGGRTFVKQWQRAFETDAQVVLVYSYNEYFEQTQIEPTVEHGDRYLLLNQILARRFKDGRPPDGAEADRLAEVIEPSARANEEKVAWLAIDDPRITRRGLERVGEGRAELREQAEIEFDVESEHAFVVAVAHAPSLDRCAGLAVSLASQGATKTATFETKGTQLAILRDFPQKKTVKHLKLALRRVPAGSDCRDAGSTPIVITGVTRNASATDERHSYPVNHPEVRLDNFWDLEQTPHGAFAWTRAHSSIAIGALIPGTRYRVTLAFRDIVNLSEIALGPNAANVRQVPIMISKRTATFPDALSVSPEGKLEITIKTPTWRPSDTPGSQDRRALGVALTHITLDRVDRTPSEIGAEPRPRSAASQRERENP